MSGLKDDLSERRRNMVLKAFALLDKSGDGVVTASDVLHIYDVSKNPDFLERRLTKEQIV